MKILTVANEKGGTGKSAIATQMALFIAETGARVLVVDLDPQGTCSAKFALEEQNEQTLSAPYLFAAHIAGGRVPMTTAFPGIGLVPAHRMLENVSESRALLEERVGPHLRSLTDYDVCVIDTPPTRGKLFRAALRAADYLLTPFEPKEESLQGLSSLMDTIKDVRTAHNPGLRHLGFLANRVPLQSATAARLLQELGSLVGDALLPEVIYERAVIAAALAARRPVWRTERGEARSPAAEEMRRVLQTVWERMT